MGILLLRTRIELGCFIEKKVRKIRSENGNAIIIGIIGMVIFIAGSIALDTPIGNWITTTANSVMTWGTGNVNKVIE